LERLVSDRSVLTSHSINKSMKTTPRTLSELSRIDFFLPIF
jgi:hypothetical protein